MKKIIRLTESDLVRIVKRVIRESDSDSPKKRSFEKIIHTTTSLDKLIRLLGGEDHIERILNTYSPFGITDLRDLYDYKDWEDKDEFNIPDRPVRHNIPDRPVRHNIPNKEVNINHGNYKPQNKKRYSDEDNELINKINNLEDDYITSITYSIPSEYSDYGSDEKFVDAVLNVIYKVSPNVDLERKRMSLNRALVEFIENLESYLSRDKSRCIDAIRCAKDFLIDNLQMFK
jgi:hypothetical protein